jgi:hypothetical protein
MEVAMPNLERRRVITARALPKRGRVALGSIAVAAMLYRLLLRQPILNWGATDAEATARLPGDELLEEADGVATRAITIEAPASAVWPWIAQMGPWGAEMRSRCKSCGSTGDRVYASPRAVIIAWFAILFTGRYPEACSTSCSQCCARATASPRMPSCW